MFILCAVFDVYSVDFRVYTVYMDANPTPSKIAQAGRRLLDKGGVEAVTMRRVAQAVGLTPMAIYRHYRNRAALLHALADDGFEELAAGLAGKRFSGSIEKRLTRMGDTYLDHALTNPRMFELMFLNPRAGARRYPQDFKAGQSPTANLMVQVIREGIDCGYLRPDDEWEIVFEIGALSHGLIMLYLGGRLHMPAAGFRALYRRSFRRYIRGLRK